MSTLVPNNPPLQAQRTSPATPHAPNVIHEIKKPGNVVKLQGIFSTYAAALSAASAYSTQYAPYQPTFNVRFDPTRGGYMADGSRKVIAAY